MNKLVKLRDGMYETPSGLVTVQRYRWSGTIGRRRGEKSRVSDQWYGIAWSGCGALSEFAADFKEATGKAFAIDKVLSGPRRR